MKLLMTMQAVDLDDPVLGVYHEWAREIAKHVDTLTVVCLKEGRHDLPKNVRVHSLGKEEGRKSRAAYAARFIVLAWRLRHDYDAVFVHMNQEYILIAGWLWKLLGKRIYMWRNHYAGSVATDIAAAFCTKTFCTSTHSYSAKYAKNVIMPVGVDLARFGVTVNSERTPRSILFFSRLSPSKRADLFVDALALLKERGIAFTATICGSPLPEHAAYAQGLKDKVRERNLTEVDFTPGVPNADAPRLYASHDIFVNCSPSGMLDKTLFEAASSGCIVIATSDDWSARTGDRPFTGGTELASRLEASLALSADDAAIVRTRLINIARKEDLGTLAGSLILRMGCQRLHTEKDSGLY